MSELPNKLRNLIKKKEVDWELTLKCDKCEKEFSLEDIVYGTLEGFPVDELRIRLCKKCFNNIWKEITGEDYIFDE